VQLEPGHEWQRSRQGDRQKVYLPLPGKWAAARAR
jgi:hypothetical protein